MPTPVVAIFDIGKTNKKLLLFDEQYRVCEEVSVEIPETKDDNGFPCEDIGLLSAWVKEQSELILFESDWDVRAINFAAYGASFVHLDKEGRVIAPLYHYLKPYCTDILGQFYDAYGGAAQLRCETASTLEGNLSSGLQLYRLKYEKPDLYRDVAVSLHLPQYLSYLLTKNMASDITSIGCHTGLWDFGEHRYHRWVASEGIADKLAPLLSSQTVVQTTVGNKEMAVGIGVHDSSAALVPYLRNVTSPFLQMSTGTWCVSMNPFNDRPLTEAELDEGCLCYMTFEGKPVKASRLMLGRKHAEQVQALAIQFGKPSEYYKGVGFDPALVNEAEPPGEPPEHFERAYHELMVALVREQARSTRLVIEGTPVTEILVDGGFSKNPIFMQLLARAFPAHEVRTATVGQATALGAALCIHKEWNSKPVPKDLMKESTY